MSYSQCQCSCWKQACLAFTLRAPKLHQGVQSSFSFATDKNGSHYCAEELEAFLRCQCTSLQVYIHASPYPCSRNDGDSLTCRGQSQHFEQSAGCEVYAAPVEHRTFWQQQRHTADFFSLKHLLANANQAPGTALPWSQDGWCRDAAGWPPHQQHITRLPLCLSLHA